MKPQSLLLALGFFAMAALSSQCDCGKDNGNTVDPTPVSGCDTCMYRTSCAPFLCATKPPKCNLCVAPSTTCTASPTFGGTIDRGQGTATVAATPTAYLYKATQGVLKNKTMLVVTAQNKGADAKIDETFTFSIETTAGIGGTYAFGGSANNYFAYAPRIGQLYKLSTGQITLNPINAIDSTVSGTITTMISKKNGNSSTVALTNVSFKACLKTFIPTQVASCTMSTFDGIASSNWAAVKIKAHLGENSRDIGRIVIEAEDANVPVRKFVIQLPINAVSNAAANAYVFPDNSSVYAVEDVFASYYKGTGSGEHSSQLNGAVGAPIRFSQLGTITHNKESRTIQIDNIVLSLADGSAAGVYKTFKGKLNVKY